MVWTCFLAIRDALVINGRSRCFLHPHLDLSFNPCSGEGSPYRNPAKDVGVTWWRHSRKCAETLRRSWHEAWTDACVWVELALCRPFSCSGCSQCLRHGLAQKDLQTAGWMKVVFDCGLLLLQDPWCRRQVSAGTAEPPYSVSSSTMASGLFEERRDLPYSAMTGREPETYFSVFGGSFSSEPCPLKL